MSTPTPAPTPTRAQTLAQYAAEHAGGPGAIYVGDLSQLVGPAPDGIDVDVTLAALERHRWIYESDYYQELLSNANLSAATPTVYAGEPLRFSHTCVDLNELPCKLLETYFASALLERTNGQVNFIVYEIRDISRMAAGLMAGQLQYASAPPSSDFQELWGLYQSREQQFEVTQVIVKDIEFTEWFSWNDGVLLNMTWYPGNDQFLFCKEEIGSLADFSGKRIGTDRWSLTLWVNGMGAEGQVIGFDEIYDALDLGTIDCGMAGANAGHSQFWYEVAGYIIGPLPSFPAGFNGTLASNYLPDDLKQIIAEELAKHELEILRLAAVQNEIGLQRNINSGMEFIPFSEEINNHSYNTAALEHVLPALFEWNKDAFNDKIGRPILGLRIRADGTVVKIN